MTRFRLLSIGWMTTVVAISAAAQPDSPDKLPFAGPPPREELQVLTPLIGEWRAKLVARPSLQDKEGYTAVGQVTGQWLHNRQFIRLETATESSKYRQAFTVLYSYDARKKIYRRWLFASNGLATESEGQWDEAKRTMTWKALNLAPNVAGAITDVVTQDRVETTVLFKTDDGRTLVDATMVATRKQ